MADIFDAELDPGKLDVIAGWLPRQDWASGVDLETAPLEPVTAYRFDDPAGEVGVEVHLVRTGDRVFQVPLTYRGEPFDSAEDAFMSEMNHSVLGRRWVYDGLADPVFIDQLVRTISESGRSAKQYLVDESGTKIDEITEVAVAVGTGPVVGATSFAVERELDVDSPAQPDPGLLLGTWPGQDDPVLLARLV
ncbi:hypothetical protein DFO66_101190 [Brevibacterium sanguinis]|uniref:Maltokinase N-terminal cap domain-containing protein n=2 Tax=Brevibacterium TaxID=1696 RepID=A0A366IR78_9MICO|nr:MULTISPECIES: hypothetical protein [Brevibacterium]RBP67966.1 hypothetical protein DFO66_101190 [Brevibacterium sanguinis]RBP74617.1 hypothetical protein DFO65_101339 [Brevibacterium celere]